jgi:hypothetical protein
MNVEDAVFEEPTQPGFSLAHPKPDKTNEQLKNAKLARPPSGPPSIADPSRSDTPRLPSAERPVFTKSIEDEAILEAWSRRRSLKHRLVPVTGPLEKMQPPSSKKQRLAATAASAAILLVFGVAALAAMASSMSSDRSPSSTATGAVEGFVAAGMAKDPEAMARFLDPSSPFHENLQALGSLAEYLNQRVGSPATTRVVDMEVSREGGRRRIVLVGNLTGPRGNASFRCSLAASADPDVSWKIVFVDIR